MSSPAGQIFTRDEIRQQALILSAAPPSRESLVAFVSWLDEALCHHHEQPEQELFLQQILALSCRAMAGVLLEQQLVSNEKKAFAETLTDLENFILDPTEDRWDAVFVSASNSYPFGPGEGCYTLHERKEMRCGDPGSGCSSGAGTLACSGHADAEILQAVAAELRHWLD